MSNQLPQHTPQYSRPFGWWGYQADQAEPRSLTWLIRAGLLDAQSAAFLSLAVELRRTLVVAAEPHQAGKTTLLTALLDFLPDDAHLIYLRGLYERFEFTATADPDTGYVLCNEISGHLPTYLWGRGVRELFQTLRAGFRMATTMHAASGADVLGQLGRYPLDVPASQIAALDLVATLAVGYVDNHLTRRLVAIERLLPWHGELRLETLTERDPLRAAQRNHPGRMVRALSAWLTTDDESAARLLAGRTRLLEGWVERGVTDVEAVQAALAATRRGA